VSQISTLGGELTLPDKIKAWQCIGCGRLEVPQDCIGVCEYKKVEIVSAQDYAEVHFALEQANERIAALERIVSQLASVTPRGDAWKECYLALQTKARALSPMAAGPQQR